VCVCVCGLSVRGRESRRSSSSHPTRLIFLVVNFVAARVIERSIEVSLLRHSPFASLLQRFLTRFTVIAEYPAHRANHLDPVSDRQGDDAGRRRSVDSSCPGIIRSRSIPGLCRPRTHGRICVVASNSACVTSGDNTHRSAVIFNITSTSSVPLLSHL
jgi:hypothetical protein